ncbi:MAG: L,D-transpeptidase family protein [Candidatus Accumulibacter sp.]|nr:L,D-transpeptidase family protein [Accumulibacter sp.]
MKKILLMAVVLGMSSCLASARSFLPEQMKFERVRAALKDKGDIVRKNLARRGLTADDLAIVIVAYKAERILEIHAKKTSAARYERLISYRVCAASGAPGPKRAVGDRQIPEGFYRIDRFNPVSRFHLSLGIDYPNRADRMKSRAANPGGDIFIHGSCVTIGCLPMTDDKIREIYLYAAYARNGGQTGIPVYIFPFRMDSARMKEYAARYRGRPELLDFWRTLKAGYDRFQRDGKELVFSIDENGDYRF